MIGIPKILNTKKDWKNAFELARRDTTLAFIMATRLVALRDNTRIRTLKSSSSMIPAENQSPDDYELTDDPNAEIFRIGFTVSDLNKMIKELLI